MHQKFKRVTVPRIKLYLFFLIVIVLIIIGIKLWGKAAQFTQQSGLTPITVVRLLFNHGADLKSTGGITNILLLGIGGGTHEGADLTDTMMVISIDINKSSVALLSIPRDIWSDTLKDKINSAYHYGEEKKKGGGLTLAKVAVEDIIGIQIHYSMMIDFSGFKNIIEKFGGIDVNVSKGFTDSEYPIAGKENDDCNGDQTFTCRYMTVTFAQGTQHMDGDRALIYVRSRHAEGEEGSDFARSRRQQEVMISLKNKFTQPTEWIKAKRNLEVFKAVDDAIDSDMTAGEILTVGKAISRVGNGQIKKVAIDQLFTSPAEYLYDGRYVLVPLNSSAEVHQYVSSQLGINP
jgi:polyisoprenyl-teichoic acid--peptidoglycan teichoic acid transferase